MSTGEDVHRLTAQGLATLLDEKKISSTEATQACLSREAHTRDLGAYLHVNEKLALAQAQKSDQRRLRGEALSPWDGVPIGLKDIFLTQDMPTSCASRMLEGFMSPYDATVVTRLKQAGLVVVGKLNMDEFAMGSSNENSAFAVAKNPWDPTRVPGGSSGGSAVAVAAGSAFAALGTDTGGSIRQPAGMTGTVGLKPTYGRVSRYGTIAYASSLDQVGPMTKDVFDTARLLNMIAGFDMLDSTSSSKEAPDYVKALKEHGLRNKRIGVPKEYFTGDIDAEVGAIVHKAIEQCQKLGATIKEVSLPHTAHGIATYYVLAPAEASSNLARFDGVRFGARHGGKKSLNEMYNDSRSKGFGDEVKRRIILGTWLLSSGHYDAYYTKAQKVRTKLTQDFARAFEEVDLLATPTSPTTAFRLGGTQNDPVKLYMSDVFTVACNLAGLPGISLPCGFDSQGLPVGLQFLAAPFMEPRLLGAAYAYEQAHDWHTQRASL